MRSKSSKLRAVEVEGEGQVEVEVEDKSMFRKMVEDETGHIEVEVEEFIQRIGQGRDRT